MINFITRYFTSLWAFITSPFRAIWRLIVRIFPPREFTVMDTPRGNVYTFQQSSFWRFTKFCAKVGLVVWASWSTYVFVYHRPMLQKRTAELRQMREKHSMHMSDLQSYLGKYNELTKNISIIDDKLLNTEKLTDDQKEKLLNERLKIWGELDFLKIRITEMFTDEDYMPEYAKMSDFALEYELVRAENTEIKKRDAEITQGVAQIVEADSKLFDAMSKLTNEKLDEMRDHLHNATTTLANIGLSEETLVQKANNYSSNIVGIVFNPLKLDKNLDEKYQKLANKIETWSGLNRLRKILPLGAPVDNVRITSRYGMRNHPIDGERKMHRGIDFAGNIGTPLKAVAPGVVISAGEEKTGYGKTVEIDHGLGFTTLYAHLEKPMVSRGAKIKAGDIVGLGGSSGRSTGPHLHYEIRYKGTQFDPEKFVKE